MNDPTNDSANDSTPLIPGVGWTLPAGSRDYRGAIINTSVHPSSTLRLDQTQRAGVTADMMMTRWPNYRKGTRVHSDTAANYLRGLFKVRKIPGLTPAQHDLYHGEPTAEQVYDLCHSENRAVMQAWKRLGADDAQTIPQPPPEPSPVPTPNVPPPVTPNPPVLPPPTVSPPPSRLGPLSPAAVRVTELRYLVAKQKELLSRLPEPLYSMWCFLPDTFLVEALRFYRLVRAKLGDTRPIPPEDR